MSVALQFDLRQLERVNKFLRRMSDMDRAQLLDDIGATVESQVRRRISEEKYDADGVQWPGWLASYAKTRHSGHSLLIGEGNMLDSIQSLRTADQVETGSNLIYFATHQHGDDDRNIAQRASLGFSDENLAEIAGVANAFIDDHIARSARV